MIKEVMERHGIKCKVAALVTDNAANMLKARQLVVESTGCGHIIEIRWGWSLCAAAAQSVHG